MGADPDVGALEHLPGHADVENGRRLKDVEVAVARGANRARRPGDAAGYIVGIIDVGIAALAPRRRDCGKDDGNQHQSRKAHVKGQTHGLARQEAVSRDVVEARGDGAGRQPGAAAERVPGVAASD